MKKLMPVGFMALILLTLAVLLAACEGTALMPEEKQETVPLELKVKRVNQYAEFGGRPADGQFVVVVLNIRNEGNQTMELKAADFFLQNITDKPEEQYTQSPEKQMAALFHKEFGTQMRNMLIDLGPVTAHPRLDLERYIIFMLAKNARLEEFQILHKPSGKTTPLVTEITEIHDYRERDTGGRNW